MFKLLLLAAVIGTVMAATARSRAKTKKDREAAGLAAQPTANGGSRALGIYSCFSAALQQVRQLGDIRRDAPRLVLGHELGSRSPAGLLLVIDIRQRLPVGVADDETRRALLDGPGRRETAGRHDGGSRPK